MKKNLIGLVNNLSQNLIYVKVWSRSFYKHCPEGKVTLVCANATDEEMQACVDLNINAINTNVHDHMTITHQRLLHIKQVLQNTFNDEDIFMSTDVFDVVFQRDPFTMFDISNYELYVSEEGVKVHEESWNFRNINNLFPNAIDVCKNLPVINSGVIGGMRNALINLYERLYVLCESSTRESIRDQAGLHVMLARNEVQKCKIFKIVDAWAIHCGVAGPTPFFESEGFKDRLIASQTPIPYLEDGVIKVENKVACIVHQFNRCHWNDTLQSSYIH